MAAEGKSPWFQLESARRRQRAEAAQNAKEETEKRWMEAAAERRKKDAIKRDEVEKWAKEDISRKWKETVRKKVKKRDSILQIQDNWNFMLSQQEYNLKNRDANVCTVNDNLITISNISEEKDSQAESKKNMYLNSQNKKEDGNNYAEGSTYYKFDIIEKQIENENVQHFNWAFPNQSYISSEKDDEDHIDNSTEFSLYKKNKRDGKVTTNISKISQYQNDTDITTSTLYDFTTENDHINKNVLHSSSTFELFATTQNVPNTNKTIPANISNEDFQPKDITSKIISDEVEVFV